MYGLFWVKNQINNFIDYIPTEYPNHNNIYLAVNWSDIRRRRVYARGLKDLGFKFSFIHGRRILIKKLGK